MNITKQEFVKGLKILLDRDEIKRFHVYPVKYEESALIQTVELVFKIKKKSLKVMNCER